MPRRNQCVNCHQTMPVAPSLQVVVIAHVYLNHNLSTSEYWGTPCVDGLKHKPYYVTTDKERERNLDELDI